MSDAFSQHMYGNNSMAQSNIYIVIITFLNKYDPLMAMCGGGRPAARILQLLISTEPTCSTASQSDQDRRETERKKMVHKYI